MYANAVGFNPSRSLLGGLRTSGNAGAFAKGAAMSAAADSGMEAQKQNQQLGTAQMQQQSAQRQQESQNKSAQAANSQQEQLGNAQLANRKTVFDTGISYDYAQMARGNRMKYLQQFINHMAAG